MARGKKPVRKLRLTDLAVRSARAQTKAYQIWDAMQRGLALRVQPTGAKSWVVIYSRHGRSRWLTLGSADAISLGDARVLAGEAMLAVARGQDPAADKRAERGAGTFGELATAYVEQYAKKHNKSWRQGEALVRRFALQPWGKLQAASITRGDVKALTTKIEAPILANQTLAAISAVFSWGIKEEKLTANPCKLIDRNPPKSRERVLSASEIPQFWAAFDTAGEVAGAALRTILLTGQRPGEVAHMRREHIKDGWWEMPGDPVESLGWPGTKSGAAHRVWIPEPARKLMELEGTGFVFVGARGGRLDAAMRSICAKLGVERATPHDLRRTFSTTVTGLSFGRDALNRVTNHREGGIASVYDRHSYADENKHIMEAVAARIMELAEGQSDQKVVPLRR
jgi:integrase